MSLDLDKLTSDLDMLIRERDEALARIEEARKQAQRMADEYKHEFYRENAWAQGVHMQARKTLDILDGKADA